MNLIPDCAVPVNSVNSFGMRAKRKPDHSETEILAGTQKDPGI